MRIAAFIILLCLALAPGSQAQASDQQIVREQRTLSVGGTKETWRLVWNEKPKSICGPDEVYMSITCPCSGWAYGERGKLSLTRSLVGQEIERFDLGSLFDPDAYLEDEDRADRLAYLQRWPIKLKDLDRENHDDAHLVTDIKQRSVSKIMKFADYDRDGISTEFLLQVATLPCMKHQFVAVGTSTNNPHLHALTSTAHPDKPLVMSEEGWKALLSGPGEHVVRTWECADHGSETRSERLLSADKGAIRVKRRVYSCPAKGEPERLVEETDG